MTAAWPQIITSLSLIGIILFTSRRFTLPFGHAMLASVSGVALAGFVFGLAGLYTIYGKLFVVIGLTLLSMQMFKLWQERQNIALSANSLPPLLCTISLLFFIWYFNDVNLVYYDEFFWGNLTKALLHDGRFPDSGSIIHSSGVPVVHPPGPAILQTLFMGRTFDDSGMALGGMLTVLVLFFIVHRLSLQHMEQLPALAMAMIAAIIGRCMGTPVNTFGFYRIGYVEYMQGSIFAALLCVALYEKDLRLRYAVLIPGLGLLCLLKATGLLFALGVAACALIVCFFDNKASFSLKKLMYLSRQAAVLVAPVLAVWVLWRIHLHSAEIMRKFAMVIDGSASPSIIAYTITTLYTPPAEYSPHILFNGILAILKAATKKPLLFSPVFPEYIMNVFSGTLSLLIQWLAFFAMLRRYAGVTLKRQEKLILTLLFTGLACWIAVRLHVALSMHNLAEIMRGASYERYIGAYMTGITVLIAMMLYVKLTDEAKGQAARLAKPLILANLVFLLIVCGANPFDRPDPPKEGTNIVAMRQVAEFIEQNTPKDSKIWYMERGAVKEKAWILRFLTEPERHSGMPQNAWNLGEPGDQLQDDTFPAPVQPEIMMQTARDHRIDFILIWKADQEFWNTYGPTLGISESNKPVLLKLDKWINAEATYPEVVKTCAPAK